MIIRCIRGELEATNVAEEVKVYTKLQQHSVERKVEDTWSKTA
jgi:hypothetical protein